MSTVTFEGQSSGDYECFCWDVTPEEFVRITGRQPDKYEKAFAKDHFRLYPNDLLDATGVKSDRKYRITVSVEEIGPAVQERQDCNVPLSDCDDE